MFPLIFSYYAVAGSDQSNLLFLALRLLTFLILFFLIIGGAYITSKYIGNKGKSFMGQKNLIVLERVSLGLDKTIYLVNMDTHYYIIAGTKNNIQLIDKLDKNSVNIKDNFEKGNTNQGFSEYLNKYIKDKKKKDTTTMAKPLNINLIKKLTDIKKLNDDIKEKEEVYKDENK